MICNERNRFNRDICFHHLITKLTYKFLQHNNVQQLSSFNRFEFDQLIPESLDISTSNATELKPCTEIYRASNRFLVQFVKAKHLYYDRLERLCRYLIVSLESESPKTSFIGVALNKDLSIPWIRHIKLLLYECCEHMQTLRPEIHSESISLALYLHTLVAFTSPNTWALLKSKSMSSFKPGMAQLCSNIMGVLVQKGFFQALRTVLLKGTCRTHVILKPVSLKAIVTLSTRPLISGNFSENLLSMFVVQILSTPALVYFLEQHANDSLQLLQSHDILQRTLQLLIQDESMKVIANSMQGTQSLALLANIVHLFYLSTTNSASLNSAIESGYPNFTVRFLLSSDFVCPVLTFQFDLLQTICLKLLQSIPNTVGPKGGAVSQWHEVFALRLEEIFH